MKQLLVVTCLVVFGYHLVDASYLRACRRSRYNIDVVIAFGISPVANVFPYNLYQNSRTPTSVSSFTKALLKIFEYPPTKVSLVSFNKKFNVFSTFTKIQNQLLGAFRKWQPKPGVLSMSTAFQNIRDLFSSQARAKSRRILIVLTDHSAPAPIDAQTQAGFLRSEKVNVIIVGYGDAYTNLNQLRKIAGVSQRAMGVSNTYYLPRMVGDVQRIICSILRVTAPKYPDPPTTTPVTTAGAFQGKVTETNIPISPIKDEVVILADDSESTRDFEGLDYYYNHDNKRFLDSVVSNTDYNQCRLAIYLFSNNIRGLQSNLTSSQVSLQQAVTGIKSSNNSFSTTNTADAITQAAQVLSSSSIPTSNKYILLVTDGQPDDIDEAVEAAIAARSAGIKIGIVLSPLFDGQISYRLSDMERIVDYSKGDAVKVLDSRTHLSSIISSGFCPVGSTIFDK